MSTLTIHISEELLEKLEKLAAATDRSKSYLAAEAVESYVAHELLIVEKILQSLKSLDEGKGIPHEEVMREMRELIAKAEAAQKADA